VSKLAGLFTLLVATSLPQAALAAAIAMTPDPVDYTAPTGPTVQLTLDSGSTGPPVLLRYRVPSTSVATTAATVVFNFVYDADVTAAQVVATSGTISSLNAQVIVDPNGPDYGRLTYACSNALPRVCEVTVEFRLAAVPATGTFVALPGSFSGSTPVSYSVAPVLPSASTGLYWLAGLALAATGARRAAQRSGARALRRRA
jgi:hypothetical protein